MHDTPHTRTSSPVRPRKTRFINARMTQKFRDFAIGEIDTLSNTTSDAAYNLTRDFSRARSRKGSTFSMNFHNKPIQRFLSHPSGTLVYLRSIAKRVCRYLLSVTNGRHIKATDRIHNTSTPLPGTSPHPILGATVRVTTSSHTIKQSRIPPVIDRHTEALCVKHIRIQPHVLRCIPVRHSFTHHKTPRRIHTITCLFM